MTPAKENLAYNFSLFEPKKDIIEEEAEAIEEPESAQAAAKTTVRPASVARWTALGLFIVISLIYIMMCDVQTNKLSDEIDKAQNQLSTVQSR
jgi:hypothetical protein